MSLSRISLFASALSVAALIGCTSVDTDSNDPSDRTNSTENTYSIVVGVENSSYAGSCPGALSDSKRMYNLIREYSRSTTLIQDAGATRQRVVEALRKSVQDAGDGGLVVFYYSGHGGSNPFPDTGIEETDGKDEFLCLYDTYLRDNEIWDVISKSKSRVLCIFDCCHSRTCFRSPSFTLSKALPLAATWKEDGPIAMQFWSGCPDDAYSYGSITGGKFTNTIIKYFKTGISYDTLWNLVEKDGSLQQYEKVQRTLMGADFGSLPFLK